MTAPGRLAHLPGYDDTAADIYETPDAPSSSASTTLTQQTSPRSASESSNTTASDGDNGHEEYTGISRRRLHPHLARDRFTHIEAEGRKVDLSDRVDGRRRGLRVRRRGSRDGDAEGLEERIARLRREIEECKVEAESELDFGGREDEGVELGELGRVLAGMEGRERRTGGGGRVVEGKSATPGAGPEVDGGREVTDEQMLRRVADFDERLAGLEQALGISALDSATFDAVATPVLPSLTLLDQQLAALNSASSLSNLETASAKIQKLRSETDQLHQSQSQPQPQSQSRPSTATSKTSQQDSPADPAQPASLTQEDISKLHTLYSLLPTLQSLSPTIPALLTRLRSLRTLHTNAANAASDLEEMERRQAEMEKELRGWREGLEKVEGVVGEARESNGVNGRVVEGWVRELERRVEGLGR